MNEKSKLQSSLSRLLRQETSAASAYGWFKSEQARKGRLDLSRAGEEKYTTTLVKAKTHSGELSLVVDQLLPQPDDRFWDEPVSLSCKLTAFDAGMEEIADFRAQVGEQVDVNGHNGVELVNVADIDQSRREYIAPVPGNAPIALSFVWMGSWVDVKPKRMTIKRFFFDADLSEFRSPEGYTVSQAMIKLDKGGKGVPVRLQVSRARNGEFEAELTRIDSQARQQLTTVIEEIWRTESGLSSRRTPTATADVGYMKRSDFSNGPHIILLSDDETWQELLGDLGTVITVEETSLESLTESVSESPSDLFVADADLWKDKAIAVERLLRSVSRYRKIPRIWISGLKIGNPWESSEIHLGYGEENPEFKIAKAGHSVYLDHVDYGAFDLMSRNLPAEAVIRRLNWAMSEDAFGEGTGVMCITQDARLRYRIGLAFLEAENIRFSVFHRQQGLVPTFKKRQPKWILLDASSFEVEIDAILGTADTWAQKNRAHVIVLAKAVEHKRVAHWLRHGAKDIVLLDPSLREAMRRLRARILGTE